MTKVIIIIAGIILAIILPYLCVGTAWLCTLGSFNYQDTVTSNGFYYVAGIFWICLGWIIPFALLQEYEDFY